MNRPIFIFKKQNQINISTKQLKRQEMFAEGYEMVI